MGNRGGPRMGRGLGHQCPPPSLPFSRPEPLWRRRAVYRVEGLAITQSRLGVCGSWAAGSGSMSEVQGAAWSELMAGTTQTSPLLFIPYPPQRTSTRAGRRKCRGGEWGGSVFAGAPGLLELERQRSSMTCPGSHIRQVEALGLAGQ